jgi:hypothetical protein
MSGIVTPAVVAAVVSGLILLIGHGIAGRREAHARRRELFAKALAATIDYREFAYAVRRRRGDEPEAERMRLSEVMRLIQGDIAFHAAWITIESAVVAASFGDLVAETRRTAGGYIRAAWNAKPISTDAEMNQPGGLDFNNLASVEAAYVEAVRRHLSPWRWFREHKGRRQLRAARRSTKSLDAAKISES